jgi:hypothetical protein
MRARRTITMPATIPPMAPLERELEVELVGVVWLIEVGVVVNDAEVFGVYCELG